jgi:hypothetical protein
MSSRFSVSIVVLLMAGALSFGQPRNPAPPPPALERVEGERQARALVANLLSQKPTQNSTNTAAVTIRDSDGKRREVQARFEIVCTPTNYLNVYEAAASGNAANGMRLTIIHSDNGPNQYLLSEWPGASASEPKKLTGEQLMMPFAGSDFWVADLGLEFLHWPQQRVVRKEMRKGQACDVLESSNPHPVPGGYARVLSWIGTSHPDDTVLVHADAFDDHGKRLKQFDPKKLEKVNGAYQLESMEMFNAKTGSRTLIEFNFQR